MKQLDFARPILALREKFGLSQQQAAEQLCCSVVTISRIENRSQAPSMKMVETALQLLGEDSQEYLPYFLDGEESFGHKKLKELDRLYTCNAFAEMRTLIQTIEHRKPFTNGLFRQHIMVCKAVSEEDFSPKERLEQLSAAIALTKKDFQIDDISSYLLSYIEIRIIAEIASTHHSLGDTEKAVQIMYGLKKSLDHTYSDEAEKSRTYPPILYGLSVFLGELDRYEEMYEVSVEAKKFALKHNKMRTLPSITGTIAHYHFHKGNIGTCKEYLLQAYYTAKNMEQYSLADLMIKVAKEQYGFDLEAINPLHKQV